MLEKYKVFVRGSTETKKVLEEIAVKLNIYVNSYEFSDNPRYQFGKCPINDYANRFYQCDSFNIWYTDENNPGYFVRHGYKEVTPQQFREIWLGEESPKQESKSEIFCCKGCEKLKEVCQRLSEEGFIDPSKLNFEIVLSKDSYFFERNRKIWFYTNGNPRGEIISPEEFYERIAGKPWEEKKKMFTGFLGDPDVNIEFLPTNQSFVKNSSENFLSLSEQKPLKIIL